MQGFLALIVSLFFLGRATKEVEEKTQLASYTRTIVLLVLSIVVGIFFYKTYQVATISNYIEVKPIRGSYINKDSLADTISRIEILNHFSTSNIEHRETNKFKNDGDLNKGTVFVRLYTHNHPPYTMEYKNNHDKDDQKAFKKIPFENVGHFYMFKAMTNTIPSVIPLSYSFFLNESDYVDDNRNMYAVFESYDIGQKPDEMDMFVSTIGPGSKENVKKIEPLKDFCVSKTWFATDSNKIAKLKDPLLRMDFSSSSNITNTLNFFTAADVSQYIQSVQVQTACHVNQIRLLYDVPIKTVCSDSSVSVGSFAILLNDEAVDEAIGKALPIHVELPTLANLQLIRSLILTTIFTALVSLFSANLFYIIRKWCLNFRESYKHKMNLIQYNKFRKQMYCLFILLLLLLLYISKRLFDDNPFMIPIDLRYTIYPIIIVIIGFLIYVYIQYRKIFK